MASDRINISNKKRDIDAIKNNLYLVDVNFRGMSLNCSLKWEDLGFHGDELIELKKTGSRITGITIFETLKSANTELQRMKREFEHRYTILVNEQKVVCDNNLEPALLYLNSIRDKAEELKSKLIQERDADIEALRERLTTILSVEKFGLDQTQIEIKISQVLGNFPTVEDITSNFLQVRNKVTRLQGLLEQLQEENESQAARTLLMENEARREFHRSQQEAIEQIGKIKEQIFNKAREIVEEIIIEQLNKLNDIELGKPNKRVRNKIISHLEKLQAVAELDLSGDFQEVAKNLDELHSTLLEAIPNSNKQREIELKLTELRQELETSYRNIVTTEETEDDLFVPVFNVA